jgi:hypothetical protein
LSPDTIIPGELKSQGISVLVLQPPATWYELNAKVQSPKFKPSPKVKARQLRFDIGHWDFDIGLAFGLWHLTFLIPVYLR